MTTALWTLVGNAEDLRCTRARQEILDLLREQGPDGMNPREIAEALQKNYHTTRSLLRKMEETGEVRRSNGRYIATATDTGHSHWRPSDAMDQIPQREQQQPTCRDAIDYVDYSDDADDRSHHLNAEICTLSEAATVHEAKELFSVREDVGEIHQEQNKNELTVINRHHRNQCN